MKQTAKEQQDFLEKIPDYETYKNDLALLRNLKLDNSSDKEIEEAFFKYAKFLPHFVSKVPQEEFNKNTFYRVRNLKHGSEDISLIRTFSYPNPSVCSFMGELIKRERVYYTHQITPLQQ